MLNKLYIPPQSNFFFSLILIVLFCFIFSLSSCTTTNTYTIKEPKTINHDGSIAVKKVIMKDSSVYNFKEDEASYKKKYKDTNEVIVFNSKKEISDSAIHKITRDTYLLFLKDIAAVKYQRTYVSTSDVFLTGGLVVGGAVLLILIAFAFAFGEGNFISKW